MSQANCFIIFSSAWIHVSCFAGVVQVFVTLFGYRHILHTSRGFLHNCTL